MSGRPEVVTGPKKYFRATVLRSFKMFVQYHFLKFPIDNIFPETNGKFLAGVYYSMGRETLYKRSITRELQFGFVTMAAIGQNEQNVIIDNEANIILGRLRWQD